MLARCKPSGLFGSGLLTAFSPQSNNCALVRMALPMWLGRLFVVHSSQ
jgi:hypothetical protein